MWYGRTFKAHRDITHTLGGDGQPAGYAGLVREGRFEEALACIERAMLHTPDDPDLLNCKGVALRGLGRYDEAVACFARSLEIDPRDRRAS